MSKFILVVFVLLFIFASKVNAGVVINEFVADANPEWIEFKNSSESAEYLKNYFVDDDLTFSGGVEAGSNIKPLIALNTTSVLYPYLDISGYFLNNDKDFVVLFDSFGNIVDQYEYISKPGDGVSIGRSPDGSGDFYKLSSTTKGASNSNPIATSTPIATPTVKSIATPQSTATSTPTQTLTPAPTKTATPTPKITATVKPVKTATVLSTASEISAEVLGIRAEMNKTPESTSSGENAESGLPVLALFFIVSGGLFIGGAIFTLLKKQKMEYNLKDVEA